MTTPPPQTPAGWYRDPAGAATERFYDGTTWTEQTRPITLRRRTRAAEPATPAPAPAADPAAWPAAPPAPAPPASVFGLQPGSGLPAFPAPTPPTVGRRSLTDALAGGVNPLSAQYLLVGTTADRARPADHATAAAPSPGWYPDPARTGALRFFNGTSWTARTRPLDDGRIRRLPGAALRLRARILDAQDAAALRRGERPAKRSRTVIPRETSAPSLRLRSRSRSGSVWGLLSTLLAVVGLATSLYLAWQLWGTDYLNTFQQQQLEQQLRSEQVHAGGWANVPVLVQTAPSPTPPRAAHGAPSRKAAAPAPAAPAPERVTVAPTASGDGQPVGHLRIPAIGLDRVFVLGTDPDQLALGPGLWKWGVMPGTPGNATISGHRTTHGAPFRHLDSLRVGDRIYVDVAGQPEAVFEVRGTTIASPFDVRVTRQVPGVRLTMTTCNPVGSAAQRLVIEAELVQGKFAADAVPRAAWQLLR